MKKEIDIQNELIVSLGANIYELKRFLIGDVPEDEKQCIKNECFTDSIKINTIMLRDIFEATKTIKETIMGGENNYE